QYAAMIFHEVLVLDDGPAVGSKQLPVAQEAAEAHAQGRLLGSQAVKTVGLLHQRTIDRPYVSNNQQRFRAPTKIAIEFIDIEPAKRADGHLDPADRLFHAIERYPENIVVHVENAVRIFTLQEAPGNQRRATALQAGTEDQAVLRLRRGHNWSLYANGVAKHSPGSRQR